MAMVNKPAPKQSSALGIRPLSPVPETSMDHSGLPSASHPKTPSPVAVSPNTLSPELLAAIATNPAAVAAAAAAASPTTTQAPPTAPSPAAPPTAPTTTAPNPLPTTSSTAPAPRPLPSFSTGSSAVEPASRNHRFHSSNTHPDDPGTSNWAEDTDEEMPSAEPSILQKVARAIDEKAHHMAAEQEVQKYGYDLLVLHEKQKMENMRPSTSSAEQVTIRDCMPADEQHTTTGKEAQQIANDAARPNCVEYVLVSLFPKTSEARTRSRFLTRTYLLSWPGLQTTSLFLRILTGDWWLTTVSRMPLGLAS